MKMTFSDNNSNKDILVIPVSDGNQMPKEVSAAMLKSVAVMLSCEKNFAGKSGQTLVLPGATGKIVLLGIGKAGNLNEKSIRLLAAPLYKTLAAEGFKTASILSPTPDNADLTAHLADALLRETYEFKKYKTAKKTGEHLEEIEIMTDNAQEAQKSFDTLRHVTESMFWASDLANEPGNVLNPESYMLKIKDTLRPLGIKVTGLDQKAMKSLGMGAALAVGQGSATPPCMVVMEYDGSNGQQKQPLALVGKGITFDSGGISLKPGAGMGDMTLDMGGSAAVVGAMRALAANHSTAHVVAIVALAENMPGGNAYRPGDILKSMSGKTIYVGNTDAEGRLVLADALTYIQRTFNPHTVVDLATLTGAAVGALGKNIAAFYANDNSLTNKFNAASAATGEKIWRMPLRETTEFTHAVRNTPLADLTNMASGPGSCTAAAFLREFIEKDANGADKCKWAHIDMAGPGIPDSLRKGWGVLLLNQFIQDNYALPAPKKAASPKGP